MDHLPSVRQTTCLRNSVLLHMIRFMIFRASSSSKTWLQFLPITFLVHCGRSSSSSLSSSHAFTVAPYGTFVIHWCTSKSAIFLDISTNYGHLLLGIPGPWFLLRPPRPLPSSLSHHSALLLPHAVSAHHLFDPTIPCRKGVIIICGPDMVELLCVAFFENCVREEVRLNRISRMSF